MSAKLNISSRFAVLKVEEGVDDESDEREDLNDHRDQHRPAKATPTPSTKKNKKKNEPQRLGGKASGQGDALKVVEAVFSNEAVLSDVHWAELEKREEEYTDGEFRRELSETLLNSRLQYEQMKQKSEADMSSQLASHQNKKKKKKEKSVTMTLDQFSQGSYNNIHPKDRRLESHSSSEAAILGRNESDFFDRIDEDAATILDQERQRLKPKPKNKTIIISQSKGDPPEETPEIKKQKKDLGIREKEVVMLCATQKKLEDELQQVKKRNQQLLHMLGQGEMKGKTPFLMEIEDLKLIGEELTNELAKRKSELEEERSSVLALRTEVEKLKEFKHSGK